MLTKCEAPLDSFLQSVQFPADGDFVYVTNDGDGNLSEESQSGAAHFLKVSWMPETAAIVSVNIATTVAGALPKGPPVENAPAARTRFIVISGIHELQAAVTTAPRVN